MFDRYAGSAFSLSAAGQRAFFHAAAYAQAAGDAAGIDLAAVNTGSLGGAGSVGEGAPRQEVEVRSISLLAGLLSDQDSRAYGILRDAGIDPAAARLRWPNILEVPNPEAEPGGQNLTFAPALHGILVGIQRECMNAGQGELATEHLLLALALGQDDVAHWLANSGLSVELVRERIGQIYGELDIQPNSTWGPALDLPPDEDVLPEDLPTTTTRMDTPAVTPVAPSQAEPSETITPCEIPEQPVTVDTLRILDAAANRSIEAVRVLEDFVRFSMDDLFLTSQLKQLRHRLTAAFQDIPRFQRLAARDTEQDVGTELTVTSERTRLTLDDVVAANFKRLQEALRSLEEYGKLLPGRLSGEAKHVRYQAYTLERAVGTTRHNKDRLRDCRLYVLLDGGESPEMFVALVRELVSAGVHAIQLRDKHLADAELLQRAKLLREQTANGPTLFVMNDRADLARLSRADGVHVGQDELTVHDVRKIVGPDVLIGVSTHTLAQAQRAVLSGADYLGMGPTFASSTKDFEQFAGLELIEEISAAITLPAFAIGGITDKRLPEVLAAGARRVAVSAAIAKSQDPAQSVKAMLQMLA